MGSQFPLYSSPPPKHRACVQGQLVARRTVHRPDAEDTSRHSVVPDEHACEPTQITLRVLKAVPLSVHGLYEIGVFPGVQFLPDLADLYLYHVGLRVKVEPPYPPKKLTATTTLPDVLDQVGQEVEGPPT